MLDNSSLLLAQNQHRVMVFTNPSKWTLLKRQRVIFWRFCFCWTMSKLTNLWQYSIVKSNTSRVVGNSVSCQVNRYQISGFALDLKRIWLYRIWTALELASKSNIQAYKTNDGVWNIPWLGGSYMSAIKHVADGYTIQAAQFTDIFE